MSRETDKSAYISISKECFIVDIKLALWYAKWFNLKSIEKECLKKKKYLIVLIPSPFFWHFLFLG